MYKSNSLEPKPLLQRRLRLHNTAVKRESEPIFPPNIWLCGNDDGGHCDQKEEAHQVLKHEEGETVEDERLGDDHVEQVGEEVGDGEAKEEDGGGTVPVVAALQHLKAIDGSQSWIIYQGYST